MEQFIQTLSELDPVWVYVFIFLIAYIENIFPPSPSDVVVVFGGSLVALGKGHFLAAIFSGTLGSTLGFVTMFAFGRWFGRRIIEEGKFRFLSLETLHKAEQWFVKYGYGLVVANRFLAGTRAVVSFFAGVSNMDFAKTSALSFISALTWNSILVYAGYSLGKNWQQIGLYLSTYSQIITAFFLVLVIGLVIRYLYVRNSSASKNG